MKVYCGNREGATTEVLVNDRLLDPRYDIQVHSPMGFEWGYGKSGPAQLALALLADHLGDDGLALKLHQAFRRAVVSKLPRYSWTLTSEQIDDCVRNLIADPASAMVGMMKPALR